MSNLEPNPYVAMHEADEQARRASIAIAELADEKAENDALKRRIRALEEEKDDLMEEVLALTGDEWMNEHQETVDRELRRKIMELHRQIDDLERQRVENSRDPMAEGQQFLTEGGWQSIKNEL